MKLKLEEFKDWNGSKVEESRKQEWLADIETQIRKQAKDSLRNRGDTYIMSGDTLILAYWYRWEPAVDDRICISVYICTIDKSLGINLKKE